MELKLGDERLEHDAVIHGMGFAYLACKLNPGLVEHAKTQFNAQIKW